MDSTCNIYNRGKTTNCRGEKNKIDRLAHIRGTLPGMKCKPPLSDPHKCPYSLMYYIYGILPVSLIRVTSQSDQISAFSLRT